MTLKKSLAEASELWLADMFSATLKPVPKKLYHYTSGRGLYGILSSNEMWGTHYVFMNDRSEFTYGLQLCQESLGKRIDGVSSQKVKVALALSKTLLEEDPPCDLYLTCFCEKADLLSQWRGYGTGGSRYCIEISGPDAPTTPGVSPLGPVSYDRGKHAELLERMINVYTDAIGDLASATDTEVSTVGSAIASAALPLVIRFKDSAFHEECEWRCLFLDWQTDVDGICFAEADGVMRPYRVLLHGNNARIPITRVIVGAARSERQAARSARLMLNRFGYKDVPIEFSQVPLDV